jgi:hypothetical protein
MTSIEQLHETIGGLGLTALGLRLEGLLEKARNRTRAGRGT